jgi:hypothetical protein
VRGRHGKYYGSGGEKLGETARHIHLAEWFELWDQLRATGINVNVDSSLNTFIGGTLRHSEAGMPCKHNCPLPAVDLTFPVGP